MHLSLLGSLPGPTLKVAQSKAIACLAAHQRHFPYFPSCMLSDQGPYEVSIGLGERMFKFNFSAAQDEFAAEQPRPPADITEPSAVADEVLAQEARYVGLHDVVSIGPGLKLLKGQVSNAQAASLLGRDEVEQSDLLPGQYEGGFKVWEGSVDLAGYLAQLWRQGEAGPAGQAGEAPPALEASHSTAVGTAAEDRAASAAAPAEGVEQGLAGRLAGQRVLELGCGHALPGLVALLAGAEVHLQDYNREVVQTVTIPNVTANWAAWQFRNPPSLGSAAQRLPAAHAAAAGAERTAFVQTADAAGSNPSARYFCGDWGALADLLEQRGLAGTYDVVLSAETIYSLDSMRSLYECIVRCLRRPSGVAYIAAKSFYFGVGGGTAAFVRLVEGEGVMQARVVKVVDDGLSNKREILQLTFR